MSEPLALARHWLSVQRPERAIEALDASGDAALTPEAFHLRSAALLELDRDEEAAAAARRGLAEQPDAVPLLRLLSFADRRCGRLADAERSILAALASEPSHPGLLGDYAELLAMAAQPQKARAVADRALALAPTEPGVLRSASFVAMHAGRDEDAAAYSRAALALDPDNSHSHVLHGSLALVGGSASTARRHLGRAAAELGDADVREAAREAAFAAHPLMWPLRVFARWGMGAVWLFGVVLVFVSSAVLPDPVAAVVIIGWFTLIAYSWVAPPLLRRWLRWRRP